jgi:hypothetical protein
VDAFAVCEEGSVSDNDKFGDLDVQGYVIYNLSRERQVAAGMIIGVKMGLTARFEIYTQWKKTINVVSAVGDMERPHQDKIHRCLQPTQ